MEAYFLMCSCKAKKNNYEINVKYRYNFQFIPKAPMQKKNVFQKPFWWSSLLFRRDSKLIVNVCDNDSSSHSTV